MTSLALVGLLLAVVTGGSPSEVVSNKEDQKAEGAPDFNYFSKEAEDVANQLNMYLPDVETSIREYVAELRTSSIVENALKKYNEDLKSTKGSNCFNGEENDHFNGAQENIETIVDACAVEAPQEEKCELKRVVSEELLKVQDADNILRENAQVCASLRVAPSPKCVEERNKALKIINSVLSHAVRAKINYYFRNAFFIPKVKIDSCVEEGTKDLREKLEASAKQMEKCINDKNV